jgi:hypothetical protein
VAQVPSSAASHGRPRWRASTEPSANVAPSPHGSRDENSSVPAANPNQSAPQRAVGPKWRRTIALKIAALASVDSAPTTSGPPSQAASGGNRIE